MTSSFYHQAHQSGQSGRCIMTQLKLRAPFILWHTPPFATCGEHWCIVMKPRSDLCWQCQQNSAAIVRMANGSEAEKTATISDALEHLRVVKMERAQYKSTCDECKESVWAHFTTNGEFTPPPPCSLQHHKHQSALLIRLCPQAHYPSAWAHLLLDTAEVYCVRCELRGTPPASQLLDGLGR